ncbi:MAG: hypothetical protein PVG66_16645 [Chromatiales bacterium]|jgi:hypothetical protein
MKIRFPVVFFIIALLLQSPVSAFSDSQLAAVARLGELNASALQCRHIDQVRRIKQALVVHLPKRRELGELFEQTTNTAFLNFIEQDKVCPDANELQQQVGAAIEQLAQEFRP